VPTANTLSKAAYPISGYTEGYSPTPRYYKATTLSHLGLDIRKLLLIFVLWTRKSTRRVERGMERPDIYVKTMDPYDYKSNFDYF
jgi:hypothetical protein